MFSASEILINVYNFKYTKDGYRPSKMCRERLFTSKLPDFVDRWSSRLGYTVNMAKAKHVAFNCSKTKTTQPTPYNLPGNVCNIRIHCLGKKN